MFLFFYFLVLLWRLVAGTGSTYTLLFKSFKSVNLQGCIELIKSNSTKDMYNFT